MDAKCVTVTWLSKVDLSNINSGEGGGGNVVELKTYKSGKRPYASGQSVRHALREALERGNPGCFTSTPEAPSCDIKNDWLCDIFGYLSPREGEGSNRRWSPLKCTPALGQIDSEIVTDLLHRMSDLEKPAKKGAPPQQETTEGESDAASKKKDLRLAYVQMTENIFRTAIVLDVFAFGRRLDVEGDKKTKRITKREWIEFYDSDERQKRVRAVLMALGQMGDFAKQARNAVSFAPDIFFAAVLPNYTQRGLRTLELTSEDRRDGKGAVGIVDVETLKVVAADLNELGARMFLGHTPNVVANDDELLAACRAANIEVGRPMETLRRVAEAVS